MPIYFYSKSKEFGRLSNFSLHGFELDGAFWPTVEHYFQGRSFPIRNTPSAFGWRRNPQRRRSSAVREVTPCGRIGKW